MSLARRLYLARSWVFLGFSKVPYVAALLGVLQTLRWCGSGGGHCMPQGLLVHPLTWGGVHWLGCCLLLFQHPQPLTATAPLGLWDLKC